jgi:hypothetical protein
VLRPPVEPMLAQARDKLSAPGALPGELVFQPKFDCHAEYPGQEGPPSRPVGVVQCRCSLLPFRTWACIGTTMLYRLFRPGRDIALWVTVTGEPPFRSPHASPDTGAGRYAGRRS